MTSVPAYILALMLFLVQAPPPEDPLGRNTPRQTLINFLREMQEGNRGVAAAYLEVRGRPGAATSQAARDAEDKLDAALNRLTNLDVRRVSDSPDGTLDDGLPADQERLALIQTANGEKPIVLRRVQENGARIWLFSEETLSAVADLPGALPPARVERYIPRVLMRPLFLDVPAWRWIALLLLVPLAYFIAKLVALFFVGIFDRVRRRVGRPMASRVVGSSPGPLRLFFAVVLFHIGMLNLELPLLLRAGLRMLEMIVALTAITWFVLRVIDVGFEVARAALLNSQRQAAIAVIPLARRIAKALVASIAVLFVLDNLGFDSKAVLAGLGIGGIALALAAQKTLENVFAGVSLVLDQPVRVGDFCRFGDSLGTVEDIGLRSTRIRTLDRTVMTVPNAQFAVMNIENFAGREKIWFHPLVSVRFDTTAEQLQAVLEHLRRLIRDHPRIEPGARVSLINARPAFDIEIFSYITTANPDEFAAIQEELLLRILQVVREAGTSLAAPVQITYLAQDRGSNAAGGNGVSQPDLFQR